MIANNGELKHNAVFLLETKLILNSIWVILWDLYRTSIIKTEHKQDSIEKLLVFLIDKASYVVEGFNTKNELLELVPTRK